MTEHIFRIRSGSGPWSVGARDGTAFGRGLNSGVSGGLVAGILNRSVVQQRARNLNSSIPCNNSLPNGLEDPTSRNAENDHNLPHRRSPRSTHTLAEQM